MTLGTLGRFFSITNYGHQIYQIYQDQSRSSWEKVPRISARFFGLSADSFLCLQPNQNEGTKIFSLIMDRVIIPVMDTKTPRDLLHSAVNAGAIANNAGVLEISPDTSYFIDCLLSNKTQALESLLRSMKQSCKNVLTKMFFTNTEITQFLQDLKEREPNTYKNTIEEMIREHQKILKKTPAVGFQKIPRYFHNEKRFQKRICSISKEPIREVVVVKEPSKKPILYDFFPLFIYWQFMPEGERPPSWPESIPFSRPMIEVDRVETNQITKDLQEELDNVDLNIVEMQLRNMELFLQSS